jgi:predicted nucleic acid-binding protein
LILLDTNVVSEMARPAPEPRVIAFLSRHEDDLFLSVLTLAELHRGVALMPIGRRRQALADWVEHELPNRFSGRVLALAEQDAPVWGELMARSRREGLNLQIIDSLLAASALSRHFAVATRNRKHFEGLGLRLINPWEGA